MLTLALALALAGLAAACTALVRRARRLGGHLAATDPYEAADDPTDDHDEPPARSADVPQASAAPAAAAINRPRPLPRRVRGVPIQFPPHIDPPMPADQLAVVRAEWPHLVSAFFRDSADR